MAWVCLHFATTYENYSIDHSFCTDFSKGAYNEFRVTLKGVLYERYELIVQGWRLVGRPSLQPAATDSPHIVLQCITRGHGPSWESLLADIIEVVGNGRHSRITFNLPPSLLIEGRTDWCLLASRLPTSQIIHPYEAMTHASNSN